MHGRGAKSANVQPRFKRNALALAIGAALSAQASAQTDGQDIQELPVSQAQTQTEDSYKVEESTSFKYTQPLLDTARTISVIPESVMEDRGVESLREALQNVSGITLSAGEGGVPAGDRVFIRGFEASTDIFVDGIRDIAGYDRDVYNVDAVEVAKGPGSAITGRGATGGSINLLTKTAKLEAFTDVSLRAGSESDYRASLDSNLQLGDTSGLRINLLADDGEVPGRDQVENSKNAIALSFATGLGTGSRFTLNTEYQKQDNQPDYGLPWVSNSADADPVAELAPYEGGPPPVDYSNYYGNMFRDYEDIEAQSVTARYEYDVSESTMLRAQARVGSVAREGVVTAPRFIDLTTSTDVRLSDEKTRDTEDSLQVLQADLIGRYYTGDVTHDVVAGVEIAEETFKRWNFVDLVDDNLDSTPETVDLYNPNPFVPFTGRYGRDGTSTEAVGDTRAVYVFDTMTLNPQWEVTLGLRSEEFDVDYQYDFADPGLTVSTSDSLFSWSFATVYKPAENGSIYFGAGNSHNPSAEGLTVSVRTDSNIEQLDPEETQSYELGTKWDLLDGRLQFNAAWFRTDKLHARTDDPFFTGAQSRFDTLNGEQRVEGLEFGFSGQLSDQWLLMAAYTYQDSEVLHAEGDDAVQIGHELPRTPEHSVSLWTRYDFNDRWAAGFGTQYISERYNSSDPGGREKADSYAIFDLMVSYQVTERFGLQLNGANLADEEYEDQLGGGHFIPGSARHLRLTASYSFE
jgi:catecholate siderophore receptor